MAPGRPGPGATGARRSWPWRYRRVLYLGTLLVFTALAGVAYVVARSPLPEVREQAETTILVDAQGRRLASLDAGENRVPVALGSVPGVVVDAILATEDRNFFTHGGVDPVGVARAALADLRGRPLQGGSTLTQQYVKNVYLPARPRTLGAKLREAALAVKLERHYDKDQILERYLNTVYFGRGAYGVQAASRAYFGKDIEQVGLAEAAYLATLIRNPTLADTGRDLEVAVSRRNRTLEGMRRVGSISRRELEQALAVPLDTVVVGADKQEPTVVMADKGTQYFVEYVRRELVRRYGESVTYGGGLRVRTTLDLDLQRQAFDSVYATLDRQADPAGALVSVDEQGRVLAMVGGRDFATSKVNFAVGRDGGGSGRQAGSTFKALVLAALVKEGYTVRSTFPAPASVVLPRADSGRDYEVANYEDTDFGGSLDLVEATANSVNTVYVQAQLALGAQKVVDLARAAGVTSPLEPNASLVLGTAEVSVLEMASAFSTFANRGVHVQPRAIVEVTRADGTVVEAERAPVRRRVLDTSAADVVNHCLRQVVERGSGTGARVAQPVAGKTGTTQGFGDAWFVGYTPKLTTAVWMGYPEGNVRKMTDVHGVRVNGGSFPARIFKRFMSEATADPRFTGSFPAVTRFPGRVLAAPRSVVLPTTTTTSTTTTTVPADRAAPGPAPPD